MKKIILSVLAIVLTLGAVSGTAYALFSDTAKVQGVTISSGNADLAFELGGYGNVPLSYVDNLDLSSLSFNGLYPGQTVSAPLWLRNMSASNIDLKVNGKLTSATNWPNLANAIYVKIDAKSGYGTGSTGWHTLAEWNATGYDLPTIIPHTQPSNHWGYDVSMYVDVNAGNEIANKTLSNIEFTLTGTQVTP